MAETTTDTTPATVPVTADVLEERGKVPQSTISRERFIELCRERDQLNGGRGSPGVNTEMGQLRCSTTSARPSTKKWSGNRPRRRNRSTSTTS